MGESQLKSQLWCIEKVWVHTFLYATADFGSDFAFYKKRMLIASTDAASASATMHELLPQTCAPTHLAPRTQAQQQMADRFMLLAPVESRRAIGPPRSAHAPTAHQSQSRRCATAASNRRWWLGKCAERLVHEPYGGCGSLTAATSAPMPLQSPPSAPWQPARLPRCDELKPSHASCHSHCRALEPPAGDG